MNDVFSFKRFALLMKQQWIENKKTYLLGIGSAALGMVLLFWIICSWNGEVQNPYFSDIEAFTIGGLVFIALFSGMFSEKLGNKERSIFYFSLPVSNLEKWTVAFCYNMIIFPIVFLAVFYFVDYFAVQLFNSIHGKEQEVMKLIQDDGRQSFLLIGFLVISVFTFGSLFFGKRGLPKTLIAMFILFVFLQAFTNSLILPKEAHMSGLDSVSSADGEDRVWVKNIFLSFWYLLVPICWFLYYLKLKEKEV